MLMLCTAWPMPSAVQSGTSTWQLMPFLLAREPSACVRLGSAVKSVTCCASPSGWWVAASAS